MTEESRWIASLDALQVECDGMTRIMSALLQRDGIVHSPMVGELLVPGVGSIKVHHWIDLADGRRIDLRARMWLGTDARVPHGIVPAGHASSNYAGCENNLHFSPTIFWALTGKAIDDFEPATFLMDSNAISASGTSRGLSPLRI